MQNIFRAIKEEQSKILMTCRTAREMWIKLKSEYEEASSGSAPLLWTKFYGCKFQHEQSVSSFLNEVEQIVSKLKSLNAVIEDDQVIAKILMSLPSTYDIFAMGWESTPPHEKALKNFTGRLIKLKAIKAISYVVMKEMDRTKKQLS